MRPFKNALCGSQVPIPGGWMNPAARMCTRKGGHEGPHRNMILEWIGMDIRYRRCGTSIDDIAHDHASCAQRS